MSGNKFRKLHMTAILPYNTIPTVGMHLFN